MLDVQALLLGNLNVDAPSHLPRIPPSGLDCPVHHLPRDIAKVSLLACDVLHPSRAGERGGWDASWTKNEIVRIYLGQMNPKWTQSRPKWAPSGRFLVPESRF